MTWLLLPFGFAAAVLASVLREDRFTPSALYYDYVLWYVIIAHCALAAGLAIILFARSRTTVRRATVRAGLGYGVAMALLLIKNLPVQ